MRRGISPRLVQSNQRDEHSTSLIKCRDAINVRSIGGFLTQILRDKGVWTLRTVACDWFNHSGFRLFVGATHSVMNVHPKTSLVAFGIYHRDLKPSTCFPLLLAFVFVWRGEKKLKVTESKTQHRFTQWRPWTFTLIYHVRIHLWSPFKSTKYAQIITSSPNGIHFCFPIKHQSRTARQAAK